MPTFFVTADSVAPPTIRITNQLLHHLRDSLRLHPGDPLILTDPRGTRYRTEVVRVTAKAIEARILDTSVAPRKTAPTLILAQALLKGEKMDWAIQKATELGVDRIIPIHTKHGVVKIQPERVNHQRTRWERIALEAAQQSERWTIPTISDPDGLLNLLNRQTPTAAKLIFAERSATASLSTVPLSKGPDESIILLVGPEGGWHDDELRLAQEQGYHAVTLGSRILRAETAAISAISIVQSRLGELG